RGDGLRIVAVDALGAPAGGFEALDLVDAVGRASCRGRGCTSVSEASRKDGASRLFVICARAADDPTESCMAIETDAPSTALITNDIVVFGLIAATLGLIFWLASGPTPFWRKFFAWVPALLLCYFVPAIYNTVGLIDGSQGVVYNPIASRVLLPVAL